MIKRKTVMAGVAVLAVAFYSALEIKRYTSHLDEELVAKDSQINAQNTRIAGLEEEINGLSLLVGDVIKKDSEYSQKRDAECSDNSISAREQIEKLKEEQRELKRKSEDLEKVLTDANSRNSQLIMLQEAEVTGLRKKIEENSAEIKNEEAYNSIIIPTVQIECDKETGSGTIIHSKKDSGDKFETYVLTAFHVVEDSLMKKSDSKKEIIVKTFLNSQENNKVIADMVEYDPLLDLALLKLCSEGEFKCAKIVLPEEFGSIKVFTKVYAVGCPLGYPPMPTKGEISSISRILYDQKFWMVNAPTVFGNSGGGIYDVKTNELIGVLSRVSAYNNFINIAVPHMGILVTPESIYSFLSKKYSFLCNGVEGYTQAETGEEKEISHDKPENALLNNK